MDSLAGRAVHRPPPGIDRGIGAALPSPGGQGAARPAARGPSLAFTLLEVMIAGAIFFVAMLALLGVLSTSIHAAALLQRNYPTAAMAVAHLTLTNQLDDVAENGDFGKIYPGYRYYIAPPVELMTNGLFQVDVTVYHQDKVFSSMSILLFKPDSKKRF
jgi:Tfp pilus assembly protein PilV